MRTSKRKTTAAVLRATIGIKDEEFAGILKCSKETIHSVESGRLKLSDSLAMRMAHETGVEMSWLLAGDPKVPPYDHGGRDFTPATFDRVRSKLDITPFTRALIQLAAQEFSEAITSILDAAHAKGHAELAAYKIGRIINELVREFGGEGAKTINELAEGFRSFGRRRRLEVFRALAAKKRRKKRPLKNRRRRA